MNGWFEELPKEAVHASSNEYVPFVERWGR
jgi:hypothetical protein